MFHDYQTMNKSASLMEKEQQYRQDKLRLIEEMNTYKLYSEECMNDQNDCLDEV